MQQVTRAYSLEEALEILAQTITRAFRCHPWRCHVDLSEDGKERQTFRLLEMSGGGKNVVIHPRTDQQNGETKETHPVADRNGSAEATASHPRNGDAFEPTDFQASILCALEYKAMHAEELAAAIGCDRRSLWKKNGINELKDVGWVAVDESDMQLGYFRPNMPPKELRKKTRSSNNN